MELELSGNNYKIGKLSAMQQLHIVRRLAPTIFALSSATSTDTPKTDFEALSALAPVADMISKMSDEDSEYVVKSCLSVVFRQNATGWAKIQAGNGNLMFDDIDLSAMMKLTFEVVKDNLGNFLTALPTQL